MKTAKLLLIAAAAVLMSSCGVANLVYDRTVPADQLATLLIPGNFTVTSFNGKKVKWRSKLLSDGEIKIPAGNHIVGYRYYKSQSSQRTQSAWAANMGSIGDGRRVTTTTYNTKEAERQVTINLEAGEVYRLSW